MFERKEYLLLATLALAKFTHIMDFMVMMPLAPQIMRLFGIGTQEFGILVSSYTISAGVMAIISAFFIDRFDRRTLLLATYAGFTVGTLACALANSYETLLAARSLTGIFGGLLNTLSLSIVGDVFQLQKRATATGVVMSAMSAAAALGVPTGLYFATLYQWNTPFLVIVGVSLPIWLGLWYVVPSIRTHIQSDAAQKPRFFDGVRATFGDWNQVRALLLSMCLTMGQFMLIPFIAPFMVKNVGFAEADLMYIYLFGGAVSLFTGILIGRLADRYGHRRVFYVAAALSAVPIFWISQLPAATPLWWALSATTVFFIFIGGRFVPATTIVVSSVEARNRASFMSYNTASQQFAAGASAIISGSILVETPTVLLNFQYVGFIGIILTAAAIALAYSLRASK